MLKVFVSPSLKKLLSQYSSFLLVYGDMGNS